jgi:phage gp36-like protein
VSYASLADLNELAGQEEILQVADRDNDGEADADVIAAALAHADNMINGYLAVRYAIPLTAVPDLVRTWAVAIARYRLHRDGPPDHVVRDYNTAIAALKDVGRGQIDLPIDPADGSLANASSGGIAVTGPEPVFSQDKLEGWL